MTSSTSAVKYVTRLPSGDKSTTNPTRTANQCSASAVGNPTDERTAGPAIRGVLFDMGDVLFDATLWRRWLVQLLGRFSLHVTYNSLFGVWDREYLDDVHRGRREYGEAFQAFLLSLGLTRGQVEEIEATSIARRRELAADLRPFCGVRSTLGQLRDCGLTLGVLSDFESGATELREILDRLGVADYFSTIVSSFDLGECKPHPHCYQAAIQSMALSPPEVLFVGHDADELQGAKRAGHRTIAFNHDAGAEADVFIERFEELIQVVQAWPVAVAGS